MRGEVKRLRDALKEIIDECDQNLGCSQRNADDGSDDCSDIDNCLGCTLKRIANDALEGKQCMPPKTIF